ncbi:DUF3179 domain-containing (seleno)protein [Flavobacteriaceae bacterium MJ-SS4]|uniref:DUF3179 domain-containing (seleno)protein n=1 Tax=Gilvirhabdus luticola TaxID=3079858 RepID=UPI0032DDCAF8
MRILVFFLIVVFYSCSSGSDESSSPNNSNTNPTSNNLWCVPIENIAGGVLEFPIIDNPQYNSVSEIESINYLADNSKVAILKIEDQVFVYPYDYTNYSEVVNDTFQDFNFALTYCPITETALCFNRNLVGNETITIMASGYLYKENLVHSDTNGKYFWSQMLNEGLRDSSKDIKLNTINIIETNWLNVKLQFQNALVYNHPNINNCDCDETFESIDFDNLFGVINNQVNNKSVHLFNYNNFVNGKAIDFISVNGKNTVVVGSKENIFFNAFYIPTNLDFEALNKNEFPNILTDNEGNIWDIFGKAVQGPREGQNLESPLSYFGAEWAWNEFFDNITVHN